MFDQRPIYAGMMHVRMRVNDGMSVHYVFVGSWLAMECVDVCVEWMATK